VIYIGKSKNIYERLLQHFRNNDTVKAVEMRSRIASVSYEVTGSELVALLLESSEIKKHKPVFNRTQRRSVFSSGLFSHTDDQGYLRLYIGKNLNGHQPVTSFTTQEHARNYLHGLVSKFELCQKLCGLYETEGACFHFGIRQCRGACTGKESPESYNRRAEAAIRLSGFSHPDFFIVEKGRSKEEAAVVKIAGGRYIGFGFTENTGAGIDGLQDCISHYDDNRDTQQIIRIYLKKNPRTKILRVNNQEFS
jgi:DNA polymerase-3 subunit epsilon